MHKLFTEGLRNEPQKQTEIGPVPESWEESTLGELTTMRTGGTPSRKNKAFWDKGTIPWVKTGEINYREITATEESITDAGLKGSNAKLFPKGTLLMAMYGQGITRGRVGLLGIDATTNQACAAITPHDVKQLTTDYLYFYLEYFYEELRSRGHGANQKNLSMTLLKLFPVAFPGTDDQEAIVMALKSVDEKKSLAGARKATYQDLFRTVLHQLMIAKARVHELDLGKEAVV
jgi:type I restriction enzyme S subunit